MPRAYIRWQSLACIHLLLTEQTLLVCMACSRLFVCYSPGIAGSRREVQLVLGSEDEVLGPDLQYGVWLQRADYRKQCQRRRGRQPILCPLVLDMQELQTALKVHGLQKQKHSCGITGIRHEKGKW